MTRQSERKVGLALLALTVAAVAGAASYATMHIGGEVARDAWHCPLDSSRIKRWTAVLVDRTDRYGPAQRDDVKSIIERLAESLEEGEGLSLHAITSNPQDAAEPWRGFAYCKPRNPATVNSLVETERFARQDY